MYHLDTDISIFVLEQRSIPAITRFQATRPSQVGISIIAIAELRFGMANSQRPEENMSRLDMMLKPLTVVPFDDAATHAYAQLRRYLTRAGTLIGPLDMLIAAVALANDAILVTNNVREFERVPDLRVENWAA